MSEMCILSLSFASMFFFIKNYHLIGYRKWYNILYIHIYVYVQYLQDFLNWFGACIFYVLEFAVVLFASSTSTNNTIILWAVTPFLAGKCNPLPRITNGQVVVSSLNVGANATYSCDAGYRLTKPAARTCELQSGIGTFWNGNKPACEGTIILLPRGLKSNPMTIGIFCAILYL